MDKTSVPQEIESRDTVTLSVRLTEEQHKRITEAAALRGWKPANLLRVAAYEKAAHILNTATETKVDFRGLAQRVAALLFGERAGFTLGREGQKESVNIVDDLVDVQDAPEAMFVEVKPAPLSPDVIRELRAGAKFGGSEFLTLIVDACEAVAKRTRGELPDPVDPGAA